MPSLEVVVLIASAARDLRGGRVDDWAALPGLSLPNDNINFATPTRAMLTVIGLKTKGTYGCWYARLHGQYWLQDIKL